MAGFRANLAIASAPYDWRVIVTRWGAAARTAIVVGVGALMLSACSSDTDAAAKAAAEALPDLTEQGLEPFTCGEGDAIAGTFQVPEAPYVAECWKGAPDATFLDVANETQDAVLAATGGTNITAEVCPEDAFGVGGGIACRAVLVTEGDSTVIVRTVSIVANAEEVLAVLPQDPSQDELEEALKGAQVEVLVGTEPTTGPSPSPSGS
jgi:hypothetical protein